MRSYTKMRNDIAQQCNVSTSDTTAMAVIDGYLNDSIRTICGKRGGKWPFLETTETVLTTASQDYVVIPNTINKISSVTITVGDTVYTPTPVFSDDAWNIVISSSLGESDTPVFVYQSGRNLHIAPTPASSTSTVTFRGRQKVVDLGIADYTTGTIVSIANGGVAVVGDSTVWTTAMVGRYIRIDAPTGDNAWYKIAAVGSNTTLTLSTPYEGTAIAAGSATYTIGQMSPIPETYDMAPVYRSAALYWLNNSEMNKSKMYWNLYDGGQEIGASREVGGLLGQMLEQEMSTIEASYLSPSGLRRVDPNNYPENLIGF
jgi:hypothetical protein